MAAGPTGPGLARADEARDLASAVAAVDEVSNASTSPALACARIAAETGTDARTVELGKTVSGVSYGDLLAAIEIAKSSSLSFVDVVTAHNAGMDWCQIARNAQVKITVIVSACEHLEAVAEKDGEDLRTKQLRELAKAMAAFNALGRTSDQVICARIGRETGLTAETVAKARLETGCTFAELMVAAELSGGSPAAFARAAIDLKNGKTSAQLLAQGGLMLASVTKHLQQVGSAIESEQRELTDRELSEGHRPSRANLTDPEDQTNGARNPVARVVRVSGKSEATDNLGGGSQPAPPLNVVPQR
jgi:hypothetical protein